MKQSKTFILSRLIYIGCAIITGLFVAQLLIQMFYTGNYGHDDWEHWASSWFMYHGFLPYRDFFQHHHPLLWYLEVPIFSFVDYPVDVFEIGRMMAATFFFGGCFFIGKIVQALGGTAKSFLYALFIYLSYPVTVGTYIQNRPDTYMVFCLLSGLYFWIRFYQDKREKDLILCYFLFFLSFAFLQKAVWFLFPFGIYQIYLLMKDEVKWKPVIHAMILPLLIMAGYGIYLYGTGSLARYWELNWILNLHYFRDYRSYSYEILDYAYSILCPCFLIWGIWKGQGLIRALSMVLIGFGVIYFLVPKPYPFYWLIWTPFLAIILGLGFEKTLKSSFFLKRFFILAFLILACFLSGLYVFTNALITENFPFERINRNFEKHFKPGDDIVDYDEYLAVFFRNSPIHYYWYNLSRGALWDIHLFHRYELPDWDSYIYKHNPKYIFHHDVYDLMSADDHNKDKKIMGVPEDWLNQHYRYLEDCDVYERLEENNLKE